MSTDNSLFASLLQQNMDVSQKFPSLFVNHHFEVAGRFPMGQRETES
jgi:hypothetical protein